jgi:methyltransferase (TIGR00027 family)
VVVARIDTVVPPADETAAVASASALEVAILKAAHQVCDVPVVHEDPLALRVVGPKIARQLAADSGLAARRPAARAAIVARTKADEDLLALAFERGVRQRVVLGAGLDTFAARSPYGDDLRTWEVDLPATQAWKQEVFAAANIEVPSTVTSVGLDLRTEPVASALSIAGFDLARPAHVSMLGIVVFLPGPTILKLLGVVASMASGSTLALDYGAHEAILTPEQRAVRHTTARTSAMAGEPFEAFLDPADLRRDVRRLGFSSVVDRDWQAMNEEFFAGRGDGLAVAPGGRHLLTCRR